MNDGAYLYILQCPDGSYYVGTTRSTLEIRIAQHNAGTFGGYTQTRRPVELVFSQRTEQVYAIASATTRLRHGFKTTTASSEARMLAPAAMRKTWSQLPEDCCM